MAVRRSYFQTAWVVQDLATAIPRWLEQALVGPFFVLPHSRIDDAVYRGSPVTPDISVAVAQVGPMQVELIEQHDKEPSPFTVELPSMGLHHHIAATTDDLDADIEHYASQGVEAVFTGLVGDARFAFFDTRSSLGFMTEIMEHSPAVEELFGLVARVGAEWDGSDPIRMLPG
ncbi:VOC family protein [Amycolatopsis pithecellobii]|uniref:ABC transporter permease n=1 Tax=Amycolatopsis pithecellobii TaxID=664692 RepID=A0A6N7YU07_9PSEU|nr:VOC family protein [Amycolatopsis pithecellobii]MTD56535.1 ABC transporter permease [Amycolatopsis pithecellobii]